MIKIIKNFCQLQMNCWGHGPCDACATGICVECQQTISYGVGVVLCHDCSIKLNQCQTCRKTAAWEPETILEKMNKELNDCKAKYEQYNKERNYRYAEYYAKSVCKYQDVVDKIRDGAISSNMQVIELLRRLDT